MKYTENYSLKMPEQTDYINVDDFNYNFIQIDKQIISATDTITTINGKTGAISKSDITALGIPSQDTVYKKPLSEPISYIQGLQAELDSKVESYGTNPVLNIAVISAGGSTTGIPNNTLILELE